MQAKFSIEIAANDPPAHGKHPRFNHHRQNWPRVGIYSIYFWGLIFNHWWQVILDVPVRLGGYK